MVQCMEAWFFADADTLREFYGDGFRNSVLTSRPIEDIPKQDIDSQLRAATRDTSKQEYNKGKHSFELLRILDVNKIESASPFAKRFFNHLRNVC